MKLILKILISLGLCSATFALEGELNEDREGKSKFPYVASNEVTFSIEIIVREIRSHTQFHDRMGVRLYAS